MTAKEIARKLLVDAGCDLWCYTDDYDNALKDINYLINEEGRVFDCPADNIARALVEIAVENPKPEEPLKRYTMIYDGDSFVDGTDHETLEEALEAAKETRIFWEECEMSDKGWNFDDKGVPHPTEKQIEDWDYMIWNCSTYVIEKDDDGNTIEEYYLSDDDLKEIGWMEWAELEKNFK